MGWGGPAAARAAAAGWVRPAPRSSRGAWTGGAPDRLRGAGAVVPRGRPEGSSPAVPSSGHDRRGRPGAVGPPPPRGGPGARAAYPCDGHGVTAGTRQGGAGRRDGPDVPVARRRRTSRVPTAYPPLPAGYFRPTESQAALYEAVQISPAV